MSAKIGTVVSGVGIVILSCVCVLTIGRELFAARYVPAEIRLGGKVLLKGNASDNGDRDADEVWRALSTIRFRPTPDGEKWAAESETERRLLEGDVSIRLTFGGNVEIRRFEVMRVPNKDGGFDWMVDPADVKRLFLFRSISRLHVRSLKDVNAKE